MDDDIPLAYPPDFAKAKRNALFWAFVTIVLAIGHRSIGGAEMTADVEMPMLRNFQLYPTSLLVGAMLILSYMLIGFYRSEQLTRMQNSDAAMWADLGSLEALIKKLRAQSDEQERMLTNARDALDYTARFASDVFEELARDTSDIWSNVNPEDMYRDAFEAFAIPPAANLSQIAEHNAHREQHFRDRLQNSVGQAVSGLLAQTIGRVDNATTRLREHTVDIVPADRIGELNSPLGQLRKLSSAISRAHRNWYNFFDVAPVYTAAGIAFYVGLFRLLDGETLTRTMEYIFG